MRFSFLFRFIFLFCACCGILNRPAQASDDLSGDVQQLKAQFEVLKNQFEQQKTDYEQRIAELEARSADKPDSGMKNRNLLGKWNPSIGAVADIVFKSDSAKEDEEGADRISVRELELVLGSEIDPFSRLDATIAFSDFEDASLEEAYMTRFGLPFDTTARFGKFKPKVGKAISVHRDSLETVDEPLVIQRYFGLEGFNKAGLDVTTMLKTKLPLTQEVSFGVLEGGNGEDGTLFGETRRRPTLYSHLKNYAELGENTGAELGFSYLAGSRDEDADFEVQVLASDVTLIHHFNANQSLKLQGEVFNANREETEDLDGNIWGWYGLADVRVSPQWGLGFRYDNVQPVDNPLENPQEAETGYTGYLTFYQSEFARWRLQGSRYKLSDGNNDDQIMIQGTFVIGEHKHKIQ